MTSSKNDLSMLTKHYYFKSSILNYNNSSNADSLKQSNKTELSKFHKFANASIKRFSNVTSNDESHIGFLLKYKLNNTPDIYIAKRSFTTYIKFSDMKKRFKKQAIR